MSITLYKYMSAAHGISSITNRRLKVSLLPELNDPYEMVPAVVDSIGAPIFSAEKVRTVMYRTLADKHGFICMSKAIDEPLLWSHYADKHKGMALVFNLPEDSGIIEVTYGRNRVSIDLDNNAEPGPALERGFNQLLGNKYEAWRYEQEARFIVPINPASLSEGHYWKELSDDIFAGVVLGCICPDKESDILSLLSTNGFPNARVSRVNMDHTQYRMNLQQGGPAYPPQGVGSADP